MLNSKIQVLDLSENQIDIVAMVYVKVIAFLI